MSKNNRYEATPANIEREYRKYPRKGRPHKDWMGQFNQLERENRLPVEWLWLVQLPRSEWFDAMVKKSYETTKKYWSSEHAWYLKQAQKNFSQSADAPTARKEGGEQSGIIRRWHRDQMMAAIIEGYRSAKRIPPSFKPWARDVANWYVQQHHCNVDSLTRRLRHAGVAQ